MDERSEKLCLEEISHIVCDADKKITLNDISNNWNVPFKESESLLQKWLKSKQGNYDIAKEFLVRGADLNGNGIISIVPEEKIKSVEKCCKTFTSLLYSIELSSGNSKRLNAIERSTNNRISLSLNSDRRQCTVASLPVSPVKQIKTEQQTPSTSNKKPINALFSSAPVKTEKHSPVKETKLNGVEVKQEKKSPAKKAVQAKKIAAGKSSISSFFSAKPHTSSQNTSSQNSSVTETKVKDEPMETENSTPEENKNTKKRSIADAIDSDCDTIPGTPQEKTAPIKKKVKMEPVKYTSKSKSAGHSRLMQLCDSSSDEEESGTKVDGRDSKTVNSDDEMNGIKKEKEKENTTPTKSDVDGTSPENGVEGGKRRYKTKRTVVKTFQGDDGYFHTVHETVEVSCSEDEEQPSPNATAGHKTTESIAVEKESGNAATKGKKKVSPPNSKKQGSILSFFSKK